MVEARQKTHTISLLVDNETGVLARIVGMFSARGYNIESLNVATVDHAQKLSRITLTVRGTLRIIEQIKAQLGRIIPVHQIKDLTIECPSLEREIALIKIIGDEDTRNNALEIAEDFGAIPIDVKHKAVIFELVGKFTKLEEFITLMRPLGLVEIARTGVVSMEKGPGTLEQLI